MIKVISFDVGGTLIKDNNISGYSINDLAVLVNKDKNLVKKYYKEIFQKEKGSFDELVNKFTKMIDYKRDNKLDEFFKNKFNDDSEITDEARKTITKLYNLGYKIILVSNSCCLIKNTIPKDILSMITKSYYSYDLGYTKNDKELYEIILKDIGVTGEEILHIGDTYNCDYAIPKENGFKVLFYGDTSEEVVKIDNLLEVIDYVGGLNNGEITN